MSDDYSIFGQLPQMTPSGKTRNSKEVPVDKESSRRKMKRRKNPELNPEEDEAKEMGPEEKEEMPSGKVLDITI
jgi:hypothetical protein